MKNYLFFTFLILVFSFSTLAQSTPRFSKYPVKESGANIYFPSEPTWEISVSPDGSTLYSTEVVHNNKTYGAIIVKFNEELGSDSLIWESTLVSYMEFLNGSVFDFESVAPFGYGHTLESHPKAIGVIEIGTNKEKVDYKVKGWSDNTMLSVLYVSDTKDMNMNYIELFLNGFRFPSN